ncbi:MAG: hypothetical protein V1856_03770 [Candidatus Liptonbacteria bacterium]
MQALVLAEVDSGERHIWHDLGPGVLITIPPRVAHANANEPGLVLVGMLGEAFDPKDTHPYQTLLP